MNWENVKFVGKLILVFCRFLNYLFCDVMESFLVMLNECLYF